MGPLPARHLARIRQCKCSVWVCVWHTHVCSAENPQRAGHVALFKWSPAYSHPTLRAVSQTVEHDTGIEQIQHKSCQAYAGALLRRCRAAQEAVDLDEWLGSSETHPEGEMLSQKLLKKLGLEGAGKDNAIDTQTSADDTADDEPGCSAPTVESAQTFPQTAHCWGCVTQELRDVEYNAEHILGEGSRYRWAW